MQNVPEPYRSLFEAVSTDCRPDVVPELMRDGAKLDYVDPNNGRTLLYAAVRANRIRAAEALLKYGANPNQRFSYLSPVDGTTEADRTVLHYVSSPEMIDLLLKSGADMNAPDALGTTPLMCAAFHGSPSIVAALLAAGADPFARQNKQKVRRAPSARELAEVKIKFFQHALLVENRQSAEQRIRCYKKICDLLLQAENSRNLAA